MHVTRAKSFSRDFDKLHSKHRDLDITLEEEIQNIQEPEVNPGPRLTGIKDQAPVYKRRLPLGGKGKRGGARLIYYRDGEQIVLLAIYAKNNMEDIPAKAINEALSNAGLVGGGEKSLSHGQPRRVNGIDQEERV